MPLIRSLHGKRLVKPVRAWTGCEVAKRFLASSSHHWHSAKAWNQLPDVQEGQGGRAQQLRRQLHQRQCRTIITGDGKSPAIRRVFGAFNFGTAEYASCFEQLPAPNPEDFRASALKYLDEEFDAQEWYKDPICSIVNGVTLPHELDPIDTYNAMGQVNGRQVLASREQVETVLKPHIRTFVSKWTDLRDEIRQAEQDLLTNQCGALVGNQCVDFAKQDGATEMEEAVMACVVERRLNDFLLLEEKRKRLTVNRKPIFVHCVSNFSNFLDLSRKVIRSLEVGIPVLILGRTNEVQQHSYRWTQLLIDHAVRQQGIHQGMITYLSCSLDDIKDVLTSCQENTGNLYMTGSRELAAEITSLYPNTIASTGGPNTMVISTPKQDNPVKVDLDKEVDNNANKKDTKQLESKPDNKEKDEEWFTPEMKQAIYTSAAIESAGQCTSLRHVIVPKKFTEEDLQIVLSSAAKTIESPVDALRNRQCDGILANSTASAPSQSAGYTHDKDTDTYWKINEDLPAPTVEEKNGLPEYWRKVVVDYTKLDTDPYDYTTLDKLADWLNETQPISLAINGNMVDSYKNLRRLFDRTALSVYTVGGRNSELIPTNPIPKLLPPALTCQARPQECEIFGEVPPRTHLHKYTKYPVYIPSSNPSYDAIYELEYLRKQSVGTGWIASCTKLVQEVQSDVVRGYCCLLIEYLRNVDDKNPREVALTFKGRTVLWGLQRPPLQTTTVLRCASVETTWDACAPIYMLFYASTARDQMQLSLPPGNTTMKALCDKYKLSYVVETEIELQTRASSHGSVHTEITASGGTPSATSNVTPVVKNDKAPTIIYQVAQVDQPMTTIFPMVGQFTSLYFSIGHVKSTAPRDSEFFSRIGAVSQKWVHSLF